MREVPPEIERPPYIATEGWPRGRDEPLVKPPEVVAAMRKAGLAAGEVLDLVGAAVAPGVTTDELDRVAHEAYIERGGYPSPLGYKGFTKGVCTSVNEVICHGIPDDRPLGDGEIVNVDVTIFLDGVHGDTNATFGVGEIDPRSTELIRVTKESLYLGIEAVRPGAPVWAIGRAIQEHAEAHGFGVVRSFCGHAIGREFHGALSIPHYEERAMSLRARARDDLHDRADDHDGLVPRASLVRRLDRGHERRSAHRAVRAHDRRHRRRRRGPHAVGRARRADRRPGASPGQGAVVVVVEPLCAASACANRRWVRPCASARMRRWEQRVAA